VNASGMKKMGLDSLDFGPWTEVPKHKSNAYQAEGAASAATQVGIHHRWKGAELRVPSKIPEMLRTDSDSQDYTIGKVPNLSQFGGL